MGENVRETFLAKLQRNVTKVFNMTENFDDDWKERVPDPEDCE